MGLESVGLDRHALGVYKRLLAYVVPHWRMFSLAILGMIAYAATQPGFAALMKPLMDESFVKRDPASIRILPVVVVALFALRGLAGFLSTYCLNWVGRRVIKRLREQVFVQFLRLPAGYYDATSTGMLISKLTYNIEQVAESTTNVVTVIIRDGLTVIGLIAWMFYLSPILSIFMVVLGPIIALLVRYVSVRFRGYSSRIQDSMGDVTKVAEEVISGHRAVKIFGGEEQETKQFEAVNEHNRQLNMKLVTTNAASSPVIQLIAGVGMAGVLYVATLPAMLSTITVGTFVSFVGAMLLVMAPLKHLTDVNAPLQKGIAAGASIFDLLDVAREPTGGARRLSRVRGAVSYRDVHFSYSPAKGKVLSGINFTVEPGETLAIVGRSGSGKSTLAGLLPRFYDPQAGVVAVDEHDIRDYRLGDLRRYIALVSQDVVLFNASIARNIAYGARAGAEAKEIHAAAKAAHALEFIQRLPQGFDTVIGDRGVLLSGGQRQRIAIARALLKNAPILILDEATSALDTEAERHIQTALERLMRRRTTLVIAHRLSTVEKADRIVVLERGRIVESGRHAELVARSGHYAALYRMQFKEAAIA